MDAKQLRELIEDVLDRTGLIKYTDKREVDLLMLTAAVESNLGQYIKQLNGPARGIFQMEPGTESDILSWADRKGGDIQEAVWGTASETTCGLDLIGNIPYQIVLARLYYWRKPEPLPEKTDINGMAKYWKKHYNTYKGKGTVEKAIEKHNRYAI